MQPISSSGCESATRSVPAKFQSPQFCRVRQLPLSSRPMELILALACDDAQVRDDGKLDVTGIFNELGAPGFPAAQVNMTVVFVIEWGDSEAGHQPLRADLVDEEGQKILTIQGDTEVDSRTP